MRPLKIIPLLILVAMLTACGEDTSEKSAWTSNNEVNEILKSLDGKQISDNTQECVDEVLATLEEYNEQAYDAAVTDPDWVDSNKDSGGILGWAAGLLDDAGGFLDENAGTSTRTNSKESKEESRDKAQRKLEKKIENLQVAIGEDELLQESDDGNFSKILLIGLVVLAVIALVVLVIFFLRKRRSKRKRVSVKMQKKQESGGDVNPMDMLKQAEDNFQKHCTINSISDSTAKEYLDYAKGDLREAYRLIVAYTTEDDAKRHLDKLKELDKEN